MSPVDLVLLSPPYSDRLGERRNDGTSPFVLRLLGQRPRTPTLIPTAYGILGMVSSEPRLGYEIKELVDNSTCFFWFASYAQN